jgi:hypothetical protein
MPSSLEKIGGDLPDEAAGATPVILGTDRATRRHETLQGSTVVAIPRL